MRASRTDSGNTDRPDEQKRICFFRRQGLTEYGNHIQLSVCLEGSYAPLQALFNNMDQVTCVGARVEVIASQYIDQM
jgi:hypothetical protein